MRFDPTIAIDEAEPAEFVNEKAHTRARRADYFGSVLTDFGDHELRPALLTEIRQQEAVQDASRSNRTAG